LDRLRGSYGGRKWRKLKGIATVRLANGTICSAELHWYECHGVAKGIQDQAKMARLNHRNGRPQFVLCIQNESYPASLELLKVYRTLADPDGERDKLIRVIDESGEDYLYPKDYFVRIELSPAARKRFAEASERTDVAAQR
jgi:hypothetical protein